MELKEYQRRVIERYDDYLTALYAQRQNSEKAVKALKAAGVDIPEGTEDWPKGAWGELKKQNILPRFKGPQGFIIPDYTARYDSLQRPVPHVCLKVPTGGGKTLLATECVGRTHTDFFKKQTGLVLWIVPTVQIYRQTWKALADRQHPYRQTLERASGGRVKVLEKDDAFNQADVDNYLCIMLIRLAATNRANNKEFLKIFRDAGKYTSFFPELDDYNANNALLQQYPDLETNDIGDAGALAGVSVKQSLVNVLKMLRPAVVIDEGHKAYSDNTRDSLNNFNPSFVLELTATPNVKHHISNVLVDVSGLDLKEEQMIKLPINIVNTKNGDWENTLTMAHDRLEKLAEKSEELQAEDGRYIRPIMVVRVERTGKDQRDGKKIHALDAKDYLIERLSVKEEEIRIKSSETDELGDTDLFDPTCRVKYIITKEALQEGWDCSFAYILTLLDNTTAKTAMTQMVGRVLRQPDARSTSVEELNQCYVYCYDQDVNKAVDNVRKGLEEEGMTGLSDFVKAEGAGADAPEGAELRTIKRSSKFEGLKIFLPKVLHKEGKEWRDINYERDILAHIPWHEISYDISVLDKGSEVETTTTAIDVEAKKKLVDNQGQLDLVSETKKEETWVDKRIDIAFLSRPLMDIIPNPWQATRILLETIDALKAKDYSEEQIYNSRLFLLESMKRHLRAEVHTYSESIFRDKLDGGELIFRLITSGNEKLNFEIVQQLHIRARQNEPKLYKKNNDPIQNNLFEVVFEKELNNLEKDFALYMSNSDAVKWWHRMVARQDYALQGWQRNKVYPDFIACLQSGKMLVLETKGLQLKGNDDTEYKQKLFDMFTDYFKTPVDAGVLNLKADEGAEISFHMLMEDSWKERFIEMVEE